MKSLCLRLLTAALLCTVLHSAYADPRAQFEPNGFAKDRAGRKGDNDSSRSRLSASEAAARVQASEGGRILSVETLGGGAAYRVKILNRQAQIKVIVVDAGGGR